MGTFLERQLGSGGDLLTSAVARSAALARANERCRAVLAPAKVWRRSDGMVTVSFPVAPGASLAELRAGRALSLGECVLVGVAVADALAAMHAERIAHGDVSAANVLAIGSRVTLVDTMGALCAERGTIGFAAPERQLGATPQSDIFALGMLLRGLADSQAEPVIEAWIAPLIAEDPAKRPSAAHAAAALARCAPAMPVRAAAAPVVAAMRAAGVVRTVPTRQDRWWRAQKLSVRLAPLAGLAVLAVISGAALVPTMAAGPAATANARTRIESPIAVPVAVVRAPLVLPEEAAASIAQRRIDALATADSAALLALSVPGSPSAAADQGTAKALADGSLRFADLALINVDSHLVETTRAGAVVEVTTTLSGYSVGQEEVPGGTATARLELVLTQRGWLVERILPLP